MRGPLAAASAIVAILALTGCTTSNGSSGTGGGSGGSTATTRSVAAVKPSTACATSSGYDRILCLSAQLIEGASASLTSSMVLSYSVADAERWSNFPPAGYGDRVGPTLAELSDGQVALVKAILTEATGTADNEGYDEIAQILDADDYLQANAGGQDGGFSSGNYHVAFLGTPGTSGTWELYFGGHHLAIANTYRDGKLIGATPSFRGVEPNSTFTQNSRSNQPMQQEQVAFGAVLGALDADQLASAKLDQSFTDLLVGPQKDGQFPSTPAGLAGTELTAAQKQLLIAAMTTYVGDIDAPDAATILARYTAELDRTYLSYSGDSAVKEIGSYVRIDGPSVWIEFSLQKGASLAGAHPHSVWRDRTTDYGGNS